MTTYKLDKSGAEVDRDMLEGLDGQPKETVGYDDFAFSVSNLNINPSTSKPDYDQDEDEYLFDASATETVVGSAISRHEFKIGTGVEWYPHIHWAQSNSGDVLWQLEYKFWSANTAEPVSYTTLQSTAKEFTYTSGTLHQISEFTPIDMSSYISTAIMCKVRISRVGGDVSDTYTGDVRFMGFDFHVPINQPSGSRQIYIK